jgi:hypothetical protein
MKRNRYGALVSPIDESQRERNHVLIAATPVLLVERDGRTFELRRFRCPEPSDGPHRAVRTGNARPR